MTKFFIDEAADLKAEQEATLLTTWDLLPEHVRGKVTLDRLLLLFPEYVQMIKKLLITNETIHA